jgi:hypothetical protein
MYIGPFYLDTKEIFLILSAVLIAFAHFFGLDMAWFDSTKLFVLVVVMLITKGLLPSIHNEAFFMLAITAIFLTIYFSIFQVLLFYFVAFLLFRVLKVI